MHIYNMALSTQLRLSVSFRSFLLSPLHSRTGEILAGFYLPAMTSYDHSKVTHFIGEYRRVQGKDSLMSGIRFAGGNSLDKAPAGSVTDFVKEHGGHTVITKVRQSFFASSCYVY